MPVNTAIFYWSSAQLNLILLQRKYILIYCKIGLILTLKKTMMEISVYSLTYYILDFF